MNATSVLKWYNKSYFCTSTQKRPTRTVNEHFNKLSTPGTVKLGGGGMSQGYTPCINT